MLKYVVSFSQKGFLLVRSCSQFQGRRNQHFSPERTSNDWIPLWFLVWTKWFFLCRKKSNGLSQSASPQQKKNRSSTPNSFLEVRYMFWGDPNDIFSVSVFGWKGGWSPNNTTILRNKKLGAEESHGLSSCLNSRRCFGHLGISWLKHPAARGGDETFLSSGRLYEDG